MHRNKLWRVNELPLDVFDEPAVQKSKPSKEKRRMQGTIVPTPQVASQSGSDSDEDDVVVVVRTEDSNIADMDPESEESEAQMIEDVAAEDTDTTLRSDASDSDEDLQCGRQGNEGTENLEVLEDGEITVPWEESGELLEVVNEEMDATIPWEQEPETTDPDESAVHVVENSESEETGETSESDSPPLRRSNRGRIPRKLKTHSKLGGDMVEEEIT